MPEQPPCEERVKLERAVSAAMDAVYAAKGEDRIVARALERDAAKALTLHVRAHGCRGRPSLTLWPITPFSTTANP